MFNILVSAFSWLTGNSNSAEKAVSGITDGLDNAFYTDQEKAANGTKILDFKIEYAKHTQSQSIARRVIAFCVTGLWALLILVATIAGFFNRGDDSYSNFVFEVVAQIDKPFMIILGFYFAAHVVKGLRK